VPTVELDAADNYSNQLPVTTHSVATITTAFVTLKTSR